MKKNNQIYMLLINSEGFNDYNLFKKTLDDLTPRDKEFELVVCGKTVLEEFASKFVINHDCGISIFDPKDHYEKKEQTTANLNRRVHEYIARHENRICIVFWDGNENETCKHFELANIYKNNLHIIRY